MISGDLEWFMEKIRPVTYQDAEAIRDIYSRYIPTPITFEIEVPSIEEIRKRIFEYSKLYPWIVMEKNNEIVAYAYATNFKARAAYRWSVESSVYVDEKHVGLGYGKTLYTELIKLLKESGVLNVIGGITLPNAASTALHEKMGFKFVGRFPEVGFKNGTWWDVGYWQLTLPKPETPEEVKKP